MIFEFSGKQLDLSVPRVMGVLNVTPDSFSDGGNSFVGGEPSIDLALNNVAKMIEDGADFIDIGGESTRPGAAKVSEQEEADRVLPVIEAVASHFDTIISVDTSTPSIMAEAASLGVGLVNDIRALSRPGAIDVISKTGVAVCLMHMQGQPQNMQQNPRYGNVVRDVINSLEARINICQNSGIMIDRIIVDPGFGFGKSLDHNIQLLRSLDCLEILGCPVLVGISRKSMVQKIIGGSHGDQQVTGNRLVGSLSLATLAVLNGAKLLRVHDVKETVEMLKVVQAVYPER